MQSVIRESQLPSTLPAVDINAMDSIIFIMDNFPIHLEPLPRRFPHLMQVSAIGHIPRKRDMIASTFTTFNFSFILRGSGTYLFRGRTWDVKAPCVITQWPDEYLEYGPQREWEELFVIYPAGCMDALGRRGFADPGRPVWYISDPAGVRRGINLLREYSVAVEVPGRADQIDWVCEGMVLESLVSSRRTCEDEKERAIRSIQSYILANPLKRIDFDDVALDFGMSPSSFRRYWNLYVDLPPARFQMRLRMRQACRMLVETKMSIGRIAESLGFDDQLYFSRTFRKFMGMPATRYRDEHEMP